MTEKPVHWMQKNSPNSNSAKITNAIAKQVEKEFLLKKQLKYELTDLNKKLEAFNADQTDD